MKIWTTTYQNKNIPPSSQTSGNGDSSSNVIHVSYDRTMEYGRPLHVYLCPVVSSSSVFYLSFFFFSSPILIRRFHTWCGLRANLGCRSEKCCKRLIENTGRKKSSKIRHLGTIAQLCRAISLQVRHVSTIGKNVKQHTSHMFSQYGKLRPTSG